MKLRKILISPQEFKESLTGLQVAEAIQEGIKKVDDKIETILVPVADGGDGTLQTMVDVTDGEVINESVSDPLGRKINSVWGKLGDGNGAVIEMAKASGLALLSDNEKSAMLTSTYGTGELFKCALDKGITNFVIGIGGSATNDGGAGFVSALGAKLLDKNNNEVEPCGKNLSEIIKIDMTEFDKRILNTSVRVACDVTNPLCGNEGASAIFGPQKGATPSEVSLLDNNLLHWSKLIKDQLGKNILNIPGAGAAGGLGAGIVAFLRGDLVSGIDMVASTLGLEHNIETSDLIITGEGQTDRSSIFDKGPVGVAKIGSKYGVPTIILTGSLGKGYRQVYRHGVTAVFPISDRPMRFEVSLQRTRQLLQSTSERIMRLLLVGKNISNA